jgi:hypothetical protein
MEHLPACWGLHVQGNTPFVPIAELKEIVGSCAASEPKMAKMVTVAPLHLDDVSSPFRQDSGSCGDEVMLREVDYPESLKRLRHMTSVLCSFHWPVARKPYIFDLQEVDFDLHATADIFGSAPNDLGRDLEVPLFDQLDRGEHEGDHEVGAPLVIINRERED